MRAAVICILMVVMAAVGYFIADWYGYLGRSDQDLSEFIYEGVGNHSSDVLSPTSVIWYKGHKVIFIKESDESGTIFMIDKDVKHPEFPEPYDDRVEMMTLRRITGRSPDISADRLRESFDAFISEYADQL